MEKEIIITPHFVLKDYFKIYLELYLRKPLAIFFLSLSFIFLFLNLYWISQGEKNINELINFPDIIFILFPFIIILSVYNQTKSRLSNNKLKEKIIIKVNNEYHEDVGESFNMKFYWNEIYKITERNSYFLIYLDKKCVKVIRKADLIDNQYNELKELFNSINIKKSLK